MNCVSCGAPLMHEGSKFCTQCGAKQPVVTPAAKDNVQTSQPAGGPDGQNMAVIKKRMYWNIKPGEVAYRINEADFVKYDNTLGLIVNDGTVAYVRCGGRTLAEIHGGTYDFVDQREIDKLLETRYGGAASWLKSAKKKVVSWIMGKRVRDQISTNDNQMERLKTLDDVIRHAQGGDIFSLVLMQKREFQLVFGTCHDDAEACQNLTPIKIRTKYHDIEVGVRAFFQITDFEEFAAFYLGDKASATTATLSLTLLPQIKSAVQQVLADVEMTGTRVSEADCSRISAAFNLVNFHGISLKNIVEISADNEDLERMRALARELYLSEQELEQLQRTNDFKNRLNSVTAQQQIHEARSEQELYMRLQEINKDGIVSQEELRKFYVVLSREARIFDAQSALTEEQANDKIREALADMERTGLLRQEETELLQFQIKEREYKRGFAVQLMQVKDALEYEKVRTGGEHELKVQALESALTLARMQDAYEEERIRKQREQVAAQRQDDLAYSQQIQDAQNRQVQFELDMAARAQQGQIDAIKQLAEMERQNEAAKAEQQRQQMQLQQDHEYRMMYEQEQTRRQRDSIQANMSDSAILAQNLADMDTEAQKEYFRSLAAGKDMEQERRLREEQKAFLNQQHAESRMDNMQTMQRMESMMNKMMDTVATMSGNMVQNRNEQKEEYREQLHREQDRHDMHQDRALNYTTRQVYVQPQNNAPQQQPTAQTQPYVPQQQAMQQPPVQQPAPQSKAAETPGYKVCPVCHKQYPMDVNFCGDCGVQF